MRVFLTPAQITAEPTQKLADVFDINGKSLDSGSELVYLPTSVQGACVMPFTGMKVFTATKAKEREALGAKVTEWLRDNEARFEIVDKVVTQSSDREFHCLSITLFFEDR